MTGRLLKPSVQAGLLMLATATSLFAHDIHLSTAEAEYNLDTRKLEVSLVVFISDLELALVRQAGKEISLMKTSAAELDEEIQRYLLKNFAVTDASGNPLCLESVVREIDDTAATDSDPTVTFYFEVPMPDGLQGAVLFHSVFCDLFKDQMNLIHLRRGEQSTELRFTREKARGPLEFLK